MIGLALANLATGFVASAMHVVIIQLISVHHLDLDSLGILVGWTIIEGLLISAVIFPLFISFAIIVFTLVNIFQLTWRVSIFLGLPLAVIAWLSLLRTWSPGFPSRNQIPADAVTSLEKR